MAKKKKNETLPAPGIPDVKDTNVEWGETNQERIVERSPRAKSKRHRCKGPQCVDAFKKL